MMKKPFQEKSERYLERLAERLEKRRLLLVVVVSVFYYAGLCLLAAEKVMHNDELFTFCIARLPHFSDVWKALLTGAEQTPPFFYVVTRTFFGLFGVTNLSIRLPEIIGVWLMGVCLLVFVTKRSRFLYGLVALLFPLVTEAFAYAANARAYALVLGFSALALLCWQWATEGRRRGLALVGLAASAAAAVSSHYYAVLILFPLALGEFVRSIERKRIDLAVWVSLGLSLTPLWLFLPLIESARSFAPHFWAKPHWASTFNFYNRFLLPPAVLPLTLMLVLVMAYAAFRPAVRNSSLLLKFPAHELAAVLGFVLIPAVGVILAKTVIGAYDDRYAFPAVIGVSIVVAWGLYLAFDRSPVMALIVNAMLFGIFLAKDVRTYQRIAEDRADQQATYAFLEGHATGKLPIVIANPMSFVELAHRPPPDLGPRLLYLADPQLGIQDTGTDNVERGVEEMKHWAGMNVQSFPAYLASGHPCFVYAESDADRFDWLLPEMVKAHWKLTLVGWQGVDVLYSAAPSDQPDVPRGAK